MKPPDNLRSRQHILTVVLEDYCHVGPVRQVVPPGYWHRFESRVQRNTALTLDLLDELGAKATFFSLGWIADRQPEVIAEVVRRGHEVASKGYFHRSINEMSVGEFREDALRSREALERAAQTTVRGYRIARGWFSRRDLPLLDVLGDAGYAYDSSFRMLGVDFANRPFQRFVHRHQGTRHALWEIPVSSWKCGPLYVPVAGGNYVRQLPDGLVRHAIDGWDRTIPAPLVFYFHIWELDPDQPRITAAPRLQRVRQYRNLGEMPERVRHYLSRYRFTSVADYLDLPATRLAPTQSPAGTAVAPPSRDWSTLDRPADGEKRPISLVIPCYNEQASLGYLANILRDFAREVAEDYELSYVFVDDGSTDQTWARLKELFGDWQNCQLVRHQQNRGVAAATMTGILESKAEIVGAIDCDSTYDPHQLRNMVPLMTQGVDLVTASPYHPMGEVINLPSWRLWLSKGLSQIYRVVLRHKLATYTSCFRVYRRRAVRGITLRNEGYVGIAEILCQLDLRGGQIVECPAVMEVRLLGHSKMKVLKTILGHLVLLTQIISQRWLHARSPDHSHRRGELP